MADSEAGWERFRADIRWTRFIVDAKQEKPKLQFHIPIRPRAPKYRPGSGPPLPRIDLRPVHDSNAFIVDKVVLPRGPLHQYGGHPQRRCYYIIGWPDLPAARPVVDASKILDYVSPRTLEDWEYQEALRREEEEEKAKEAKERELAEANATAAPAGVGPKPGAKRRPGRPPNARMKVAEPSPEPELNSEQEEIIHKRMRGPSLSTPRKSRLVQQLMAEEEMRGKLEVEDEDAELAIQRQLDMLGESRGISDGDVHMGVVEDLNVLRLSSAVPDISSGRSDGASSARPARTKPAAAPATAATGAVLPKHPMSTTPIPLPSAFSRMMKRTPKSQAKSGAPITVAGPHIADSRRSPHQADQIHNREWSSADPPSHTNGFTPIGGTFQRPPKRPADDSPISADVPAKSKSRKSKKKKLADLAPEGTEAASSPNPALGLVQGEQDYIVKRLEGDYVLDGIHWFKVRWEGDWPDDQNPTWEPRENIAEKMVKQYLKRKGKREAGRQAKTSSRKKSKIKQTDEVADFAKSCMSVAEAFEGQADLDGTDDANLGLGGEAQDGNAGAGDGLDELLVIDEDKELAAIENRKAMEAQWAANFASMARATPRRF